MILNSKKTQGKRQSATLVALLLTTAFGICSLQSAQAKGIRSTKNEKVTPSGILETQQARKTVRGIIRDETGEVVAGAAITVFGPVNPPSCRICSPALTTNH